MKAIFTNYHGPTNFKGARIIADDGDGNRVSVPYPYLLDIDNCHLWAAKTLCDKMGWKGDLVQGWHKDTGVFVFSPERASETQE